MVTLPGPVRVLYPFAPRWFDRRGIKLHFVDEGRGEPIVMVHGNPSWSFYYRNLIAELSRDYRCVAPDHVGMGLSDKPADADYRYTLESRIDDLEALLDSLGLRENLTLVVHDWGGPIGMGLAARHPEWVARLVVLNTFAFPLEKRAPWQIRLARTPVGAALVQGLNVFSRGAVRRCVARPMAPAVAAGYLAPYSSWASRRAVLRFVQDIPLTPQEPAYSLLRRIGDDLSKLSGKPMLIAWGLRDFVFDGEFFAQWRRRFPAAEAQAFDDAGHFVLEDAGPRVAAMTRSFLERHALKARA